MGMDPEFLGDYSPFHGPGNPPFVLLKVGPGQFLGRSHGHALLALPGGLPGLLFNDALDLLFKLLFYPPLLRQFATQLITLLLQLTRNGVLPVFLIGEPPAFGHLRRHHRGSRLLLVLQIGLLARQNRLYRGHRLRLPAPVIGILFHIGQPPVGLVKTVGREEKQQLVVSIPVLPGKPDHQGILFPELFQVGGEHLHYGGIVVDQRLQQGDLRGHGGDELITLLNLAAEEP